MAKEDAKGIGGWLWVFLFTLVASAILNFIVGIADISTVLKSQETTQIYNYGLAFLDFLYFSGLIGFALYAYYSFVKLKSNAVSLGKMFLILIFLSNILVLVFSKVTGEPLASRSLFYSVIWFLYLTYSKRVENTFPVQNRETYPMDKLYFFTVLAFPFVFYFLALTN